MAKLAAAAQGMPMAFDALGDHAFSREVSATTPSEPSSHVHKELGKFAAALEQIKADFLVALSTEVTHLRELREKDVAEVQAIKQGLASIFGSAAGAFSPIAPNTKMTNVETPPMSSVTSHPWLEGLRGLVPSRVFQFEKGGTARGSSMSMIPSTHEAGLPNKEDDKLLYNSYNVPTFENMVAAKLDSSPGGFSLSSARLSASSCAGGKFDGKERNNSFTPSLTRTSHAQPSSPDLLCDQQTSAVVGLAEYCKKRRHVEFEVYCNKTRMGHHIRLVGSIAVMGHWDPQQGLMLQTCASDFPMWRLKVDVGAISAEKVIEYKYVICDADGSPREWESRSNRTLNFKGQSRVQEVWDSTADYDSHFSGLSLSKYSLQTPSERMTREASYSVIHAEDTLTPNEARVSESFSNHYQMLGAGPLGEGAFGQVWRCRPTTVAQRDADERAAKIVRTQHLKPHELQSIIGKNGEIAIHEQLKHDHIVQLHEYFIEDGHAVTLVLEYCRGGDLFDSIVSHNGLPEATVASMLRHVLLALHYLHERWIVHRDVKCENILVKDVDAARGSTFKLCDFGLAARMTSEGLREVVGSPDTVAPEVVRGERYGSRVDLWSAGVVTYMALVARSPFLASSTSEVLQRVRIGNFDMIGPDWANISNSTKAMISKLMTVEPHKRPCAENALAQKWFGELLGSAWQQGN
eukprot:TRINITY_DN110648_c0_g1_i1.p1 TRINITY_DN110648_c0_g1~~TRINITY_DN110648_c0_g1_i1.p1  ORF type:complete len:703 (-),score=120.58 TRINITY_DN110648_c0_g1_i1:42-2114(-)